MKWNCRLSPSSSVMSDTFILLNRPPQRGLSFAPDVADVVWFFLQSSLWIWQVLPICSPLCLPCSLFSNLKDPRFGCLLGATTQVFVCPLGCHIAYIFVQYVYTFYLAIPSQYYKVLIYCCWSHYCSTLIIEFEAK